MVQEGEGAERELQVRGGGVARRGRRVGGRAVASAVGKRSGARTWSTDATR